MKSFVTLILVLFIVGCSGQGTNTGNPDKDTTGSTPNTEILNPVDRMISGLCSKIQTCYPSSNYSLCTLQIPSLAGFTSEIGFDPPYSSLEQLKTAYSDSTVAFNQTSLTNCLDAVSGLSCANALVTNAYSTSNANNFANLFYLFRASSRCRNMQ